VVKNKRNELEFINHRAFFCKD